MTSDLFPQDFKYALFRMWDCIGLPPPDDIQMDIAEFLDNKEYTNF